MQTITQETKNQVCIGLGGIRDMLLHSLPCDFLTTPYHSEYMGLPCVEVGLGSIRVLRIGLLYHVWAGERSIEFPGFSSVRSPQRFVERSPDEVVRIVKEYFEL